jgi:hypothetical protein
VSLPPDEFALAIWAVYDAEREAKRNRPTNPATDGFPAATGDAVVIADPDAYAASALQRAVDELSQVGADTPDQGAGRNHALNGAAYSLGKLVGAELLDADTVEEALLGACETNGLAAWTGTYACYATIRSGLTAGQREPLQWVQGEKQTVEPATPFQPVDGLTLPTMTQQRSILLTPASSIAPRPVHWLWDGRIALGTLALLGGREGIGKSTLAYTLAADVTRGKLAGRYNLQPRPVIVAATEDSWAHTIVPRLMAADANLDMVFRVDVVTSEGVDTTVSLPRDLVALESAVKESGAALILLDPLMSRLDESLDTHKDGEVRRGLEPLVAIADRTGSAILGLIHVNKSGSTDPLTSLMASRAFAAVARAVLFVMRDPDDEAKRLLGTPKNNLGRDDLPTLAFTIETYVVMVSDEGEVTSGKLVWLGESDRSIRQALEEMAGGSDVRSASAEAADWLADYLQSKGGEDDSRETKTAGSKFGHSEAALKAACRRLRLVIQPYGFPRRTKWALPVDAIRSASPFSVGSSPGETSPAEPTDPTGQSGQASGAAVGPVGPVGVDPTGERPTDLDDWPEAAA